MQFRYRLYLLIFLVGMIVLFTLQGVIATEIEEILSSAPSATDYPEAGAVVIRHEEKDLIKADGTSITTVHRLIKIFEDRGKKEYGEIRIPYSTLLQKITINKARTITPDGKTVEPSPDAINDVTPPFLLDAPIYSDIKWRTISMPALEKNAIIDIEVTIEQIEPYMAGYFFGEFGTQEMEPIGESQLIVVVPREMKFSYVMRDLNVEPEETSDEETVTYSWEIKNIPALVEEPLMPEDMGARIMFSSISTWNEVARWFYQLASPQIQSDEAIKAKVEELTRNKETPPEKIKAIYNFVASEIRYVGLEFGIGGYRPHAAQETFRNRYGDCKDKTILFLTMLKEIGVTGYPALIRAFGETDTRLASPGQFNHAIAVVPQGEDYFWFDPTAETCSYGDLPSADQGREVLITMGEEGKFVRTPVFPPAHNLEKFTLQAVIQEDGSLKGEIEMDTTGAYSAIYRSVFKRRNPEERQAVLESILNFVYPGANLRKWSTSELTDLNIPISLKISIEHPHYVETSEDMIFFKVPGRLSLLPTANLASWVGKDERRYPFQLDYISSTSRLERKVEITLPEGYLIRIPKNFSMTTPSGSFHSNYEKVERKIIYNGVLEFNYPIISTAEYSELKKLINAAVQEEGRQIVLLKE